MTTARKFAFEVTAKLQSAGFTALWAGGCVRDDLLGILPKDFDVATNATPDQIRSLFGHKRTLAIGAAFGVITVLGPYKCSPIEVATFRRDGGYSDGRRPDSIEFTDAKEDALRRDFTINGMFFDPVQKKVIDYVGGQADLHAKRIRAIGDAEKRIDEDKLRMLRAARFAATYKFEIESETMKAIQNRAHEINAVSHERIGAEVLRMFAHRTFLSGFDFLIETGLWNSILPTEFQRFSQTWTQQRRALQRLRISSGNKNPTATVIAVLLRPALDDDPPMALNRLQGSWKLSNDLSTSIGWIVKSIPILATADQHRWSVVQRWLVHQDAEAALDVIDAVQPDNKGVPSCRSNLLLPENELNPQPFLNGQDLIDLGIRPGPEFKTVLEKVRDDQLDGKLKTRESALEWVARNR